ncbi:hypothetical protein C8R43DRAFT_1121262 [Mycena crocata]|nr:hypothetical protein C8R43DRAFT_1143394 [Mycena crocata]KAJ7169390.1 hypothetical protein C8R43DRAFT_1121262 [Mycena crocata]
MTSRQETIRLHGRVNQPHFKTNVRHRALLRKSAETFSDDELAASLQQTINLRVTTGSESTFYQLGRISNHRMVNGRAVFRQTEIPEAETREALRTYYAAYNAYFMSQGNDYRVRNPGAHAALQAAEQAWHDWVVRYRAARGMSGRPDWALQPLPGFQRVCTTPIPATPSTSRRVLAPATPSTPRRVLAPATPSTSRRVLAPATPSTSRRALAPATPRRAHAVQLPTPPASSPAGSSRMSHQSSRRRAGTPQRQSQKRKKHLGYVEISDSEDEDERPRKKSCFLGYLDLTI